MKVITCPDLILNLDTKQLKSVTNKGFYFLGTRSINQILKQLKLSTLKHCVKSNMETHKLSIMVIDEINGINYDFLK